MLDSPESRQGTQAIVNQSGATSKSTAAVVVVIATVDPHGPLRGAGDVQGRSQDQSHLFKRSVAAVFEEEVLHLIVGYEDVGVAVAVVIGAGYSHPPSRRETDARGRACVRKRSVAVVPVEGIGIGFVFQGALVHDGSSKGRGDVLVVGELDVVGYVEIEVTVLVGVEKRDAGANPVSIAHACLGGHVGERAVAVIAIENVGAVVVDVEILVSIVIVVCRGDSQPMPGIAHPRFLRSQLLEPLHA